MFLVSFLVFSYRELYLELYDNKKFFITTFIFFSSIIFLVVSDSFITICLGWEGLGLSSVLLIIFYPNKVSMYNRIMTMFYNRLGDVILILSFSLSLIYVSYFIFYTIFDCSVLIFLLTFCAFTKSAQFPLSAWLPAAISAPTPISSMVHSSTLVTAGAYLIFRFFYYYFYSRVCFFFLMFRLFSFMIGGVLSFLELDFKKIIAYSTISQVRIIIFFIFSLHRSVAIFHIVLHAFFKTLLFVGSGFMFRSVYSTQVSLFVSFFSPYHLIFFLFSLRLFIIRGFYFSGSFYRKDYLLEFFFCDYSFFYIFWFIMGSIFTVVYCSKFLDRLFNYHFNNFFYSKYFFFLPIFFFSFFLYLMPIFFRYLYNKEFYPIIYFIDLNLITFFFFFFFFFIKITFSQNFFYFIPLELHFSKYFIFSSFKSLLANSSDFFFNDLFFFKSFFVSYKTKLKVNFSFSFYLFFLIFFVFTII